MQAYNDTNSDPDFTKPLHHKRPFGAGIKRKRIDFVPQSAVVESQTPQAKPPAGDRYLSIVIPSHKSTALGQNDQKHVDIDPHPAASTHRATSAPPTSTSTVPADTPASTLPPSLGPICQICHLPISFGTSAHHASSLAHQICLPHAHPPSHLDRHRKGLSFLSSYGWDPDARRGLGTQGDGRLYPVQPKQREGRVGVGGDERVEGSGQGIRVKRRVKETVRRGNETRREKADREREEVRRLERIRMLVLGRDDVNKMLGVEL